MENQASVILMFLQLKKRDKEQEQKLEKHHLEVIK